MAYEERRNSLTKPHSISLEDRKTLNISGVERVDSFDEREIIMLTSGGSLIIRGSDMHMAKLELTVGEAAVTGCISELCYEETAPSGSLWSKLFR
ncbi:MAG: sporulation protein YabP [Oscillospiraceae bacterium]|nr:sporulation protein YabP [Oscillospiraceae bacterium]